MAGTAVLRGVQMGGRPAGGVGVIVAINAAAKHLRMIDPGGSHRHPGGRRLVVAGLALIAGGQVTGGLAAGVDAVMATDAITGEAAMVDHAG